MNTLTVITLATSIIAGPGWVLTAHRARQLSHRLRTDQLTGLANRDALVAAFRRACQRRGPAVGVLLLDLDRFKQVNDTHGHDIGNRVLRHVATQLHHGCRDGELAIRLHGDEFAILLGQLPAGPEGKRRAEQRAVEFAAAVSHPLPGDEHRLAVTPSIGAAVAAAWHADLSALLRAADQRMYARKFCATASLLPTGGAR